MGPKIANLKSRTVASRKRKLRSDTIGATVQLRPWACETSVSARTLAAAIDCSSFILHRSSFMNRAIILVCDSLGVGELPDAKDFGDEGSNTLGHVIESQHPHLPNQ